LETRIPSRCTGIILKAGSVKRIFPKEYEKKNIRIKEMTEKRHIERWSEQ
jgi:hypothetical protein